MSSIPSTGHVAQQASLLEGGRVIDAEGARAQVVAVDHDGDEAAAMLRTERGRTVRVPANLLALGEDGTLRLAFSFELLENDGAASEAGAGIDDASRQTVIPVIEETPDIARRTVDAGSGVRLHKTVSMRNETVDLPLMRDELSVERVPVGRIVPRDDPPAARQEGDTWIVPVLEEVLVVERQLRLKEEVRITRQRREIRAPQTVALRTEEVAVERFDEGKRTRPKQAP
ncbi:MAG: YsnF/AvaK domain-containing protein [Burkholderiaceae bacterium]